MFHFGGDRRKTSNRVVRSRPRRAASLAPRRVQENRARYFTRVWFFILSVLFLGVSAYSIFLSNFLKVDMLSFSDQPETLTQADALQVVHDYVNTRVLGIFSRENYLFFSQASVERVFQERFRTIRSVRLKKQFPHEVVMSLDERHPRAYWCVRDECYLVDEEGYVFDRSDQNLFALTSTQDTLTVPIFVQDADNGEVLDETVLSPDEVKEWTSFWKLFQEECGIGVRLIRLPEEALYEFTVETSEGWPVRMSTEFSFDRGIRMLKTFLGGSIVAQERQQLESVDLRSENKIFYTLKGSDDGENKDKDEEGDDEKEKE